MESLSEHLIEPIKPAMELGLKLTDTIMQTGMIQYLLICYLMSYCEFLKMQLYGGGNYFPILWKNGCKGFIFWDKKQPVSNFSDGELAYTTFNKVARCFRFPYYGNINSEANRIHPTQKPVALYAWLLKEYAKEGQKIFDPFLGSGSSRIAAYKMGFDFVGCELDKDYFSAQEERFQKECHGIQKLSNGYEVIQKSLF